MALDELITQLINSPFFQLAIVLALVGIAILKLTGKLGGNVKIISRPEIIKKKMIKIMEMNKSKTHFLRQHDHLIGLMSNVGFYQLDGKKLYLFLFSPTWFWVIPKFWVSDVMIVSEDFIEKKEETTHKTWRGQEIGTPTIKYWELSDDYFIDDYFMFKMNLSDSSALDFIKMKLTLDESEVSSGAYLAQAMRLSSVDFSKAYEPSQADIEAERFAQASEGNK